MKTIVAINECGFGSTGNVARNILEYFSKKGFNTYLATYRGNTLYSNSFKITGGMFLDRINRVLCRIDGSDGFNNKHATKKLLKWFDIIKPNYISLHNVHGRYINIEILFKYCKNHNIKIFWTLHDCWAFTGRCAHFEMANCNKWQDKCGNCPSRNEYPAAYLIDGSTKQLRKKTECLENIKELVTFVSPSEWLKDNFKKSKLSNFNIVVINNGIKQENITSDYVRYTKINNIDFQSKKVFAFVTPGYSERKGLTFINRLSNELDPSKYQFIVVGIENKNLCSKNIYNYGYIEDKNELMALLSKSTALINPTLEENFPTINIEALSCGTPVITFKTGGSAEIINKKTGISVEKGNYDELKNTILNFDKNNYKKEDCLSRAKLFTAEKMAKAYFELITKGN